MRQFPTVHGNPDEIRTGFARTGERGWPGQARGLRAADSVRAAGSVRAVGLVQAGGRRVFRPVVVMAWGLMIQLALAVSSVSAARSPAAATALRAQSPPNPVVESAAPSPDGIEELRRALDSEGPEARDQREAAVTQLLSMPEPAAHAVLHDRLRRGDDLERVTRFVLRRLTARLRNPIDPLFGRANPDDDARAALRRSYVEPLVDCHDRWRRQWAHDAEVPATPGTGSAPDATSEAAATSGPSSDRAAFRALLVRAFTAFDSRDRAQAFERLLSVADGAARARAARAAGLTRDLGLARRLGELLDSASTDERSALDGALADLTSQPRPFVDAAAFRSWYEREVVEARRDFVDLAVLALQAERDGRSGLELELLSSLVRQQQPNWRRLATALGERDDRFVAAALYRVQPELRRRKDGGRGDATDRRSLVALLLDAVRARAGVPQAACVELAAYLVDPAAAGDRELAQRIRELLLADVASGVPARQVPALRGLERFPCAECRLAVVRAVSGVLESTGAAALDRGVAHVLVTALRTLTADGWHAPAAADAEGTTAWLGALRHVLDHSATSIEQRQLAANALARPMASGTNAPSAIATLGELVGDATQGVDLRVLCLVQLHGLARQGLDGFTRALVASLALDAPGPLCTRAAQLAARLPSDPSEADRVARLCDALIARLLQESDVHIAMPVADSLKRLAERHNAPDDILARLLAALEPLAAGDGGSAPQSGGAANSLPPNHAQVIEVARLLAARPDCASALWIRVGEVLVGSGGDAPGLAPTQARIVIDQHPVDSLVAAGAPAELVLRARRLVVGVAFRKPSTESWADRPQDAARTAAALTALAEANQLDSDPQTTLLQIELASETGRHARALEFADQLPTDAAASDPRYTASIRAPRGHRARAQRDPSRAIRPRRQVAAAPRGRHGRTDPRSPRTPRRRPPSRRARWRRDRVVPPRADPDARRGGDATNARAEAGHRARPRQAEGRAGGTPAQARRAVRHRARGPEGHRGPACGVPRASGPRAPERWGMSPAEYSASALALPFLGV